MKKEKLPNHIAIICDGSRRWAKRKGIPEFSGHKHAVEVTIDQLVNHGISLKIPYLSFWILSTENWQRGKSWMRQYFQLLHFYFKTKLKKLIAKGVKVKTIGNISQLPLNIQKILKKTEEVSKNNQQITVIIAINYGGRDEILRAIRHASLKFKVKSLKLTGKQFSSCLDTAGIPDPDLIIRTGGAQRLSGFMSWQCQYSEFYFTPVLMPDFTVYQLGKAIEEFNRRKRNFGK